MVQRILITSLIVAALALQAAAHEPKTWGDGYDFAAEELRTGEELSRESLTDGKALVLLTWAPDCPHCAPHMPYVAALLKKLDLDEVNFATACLDGDEDAALDFMDERELDWPILYGVDEEFAEPYYEFGWPTTYVFAPGGKYVGQCDTQGPSYIRQMLELVDDAR